MFRDQLDTKHPSMPAVMIFCIVQESDRKLVKIRPIFGYEPYEIPTTLTNFFLSDDDAAYRKFLSSFLTLKLRIAEEFCTKTSALSFCRSSFGFLPA